MYESLNKEAVRNGDTHLSGLNLVIQKQFDWHVKWAFALFKMLANDPAESRWDYLKSLGYGDWPGDYRWGRTLSDPRETPEETKSNVEIIGEWVDKWYPKACEAVSALAPLFAKHGMKTDVKAELQRLEAGKVKPLYEKYGLPFMKKKNSQ